MSESARSVDAAVVQRRKGTEQRRSDCLYALRLGHKRMVGSAGHMDMVW